MSSNYPNMSYCQMENTARALTQVCDTIECTFTLSALLERLKESSPSEHTGLMQIIRMASCIVGHADDEGLFDEEPALKYRM